MEAIEKLLKQNDLSDQEINELVQLGYNFEKGILYNQDYKIAKKIYEKGASYNHPKALNNLGWLYQNGFQQYDYSE